MNDREKLVELISEVLLWQDVTIDNVCKQVADRLIANGVVVQKHGRWIVLGQRTYGSGRSYTHYCSECGQHGFDDYKRCPNCGARMDVEGT